MKRKQKKATNLTLSRSYLDRRLRGLLAARYPKPKWITFCEVLLEKGYTLTLYEARQTYSKYITVLGEGAEPFKVRFSNHKPIAARELRGDCDFFVGVTNLGTNHTGQAIMAVQDHFGSKNRCIFN